MKTSIFRKKYREQTCPRERGLTVNVNIVDTDVMCTVAQNIKAIISMS